LIVWQVLPVTFMFDGQLMPGNCVSTTVTVKLHIVVLGGIAVSDALHVTVAVPFANVVPLAGVQVTVTAPSQTSVAVGVA
jgi:hypothetical protein